MLKTITFKTLTGTARNLNNLSHIVRLINSCIRNVEGNAKNRIRKSRRNGEMSKRRVNITKTILFICITVNCVKVRHLNNNRRIEIIIIPLNNLDNLNIKYGCKLYVLGGNNNRKLSPYEI